MTTINSKTFWSVWDGDGSAGYVELRGSQFKSGGKMLVTSRYIGMPNMSYYLFFCGQVMNGYAYVYVRERDGSYPTGNISFAYMVAP